MKIWATAGALVLCWAVSLSAQAPSELSARAGIEFGPDRGQNYGTLFEVTDAEGQVIAGAGFAAVYNTQPRGDRELLQVFLRPPTAARGWEVERLPAIASAATGFYPFGMQGDLYVHNRSEKGRLPTDPSVYRWDRAKKTWIGEPEIIPYSERVAGKVVAVTGEAVLYDEAIIFKPDSGSRLAEHYYAHGVLFLKEVNREATPPVNRLIACPWNPESNAAITPRSEWTLDLPIPFEFIYAFGQLRDHVLAVSNNGRVLRFDGQGWTTLRTPPVPAVSYQVYSILNYYDRLLLGQYPTGEIIEYDGDSLQLLEGWPPVLPGVSASAREAQSLAIYGGDLYAGVWPWGEVWRHDALRSKWAFAARMFQHPLPTDAVVHPYEAETQRVDAVANLWGQRVTGFQPFGPSLAITTSSKSSGPWDPKFSFLSERQLAEYGAIYQATVPGNLAAAIRWSSTPTEIIVKLAGNTLSIVQDGRVLEQVEIPEHLLAAFQPASISWGEGVFGIWQGKRLEPIATE